VHVVQVPQGKDITEYHLQGGDVYGWLDDEMNLIRENAILSPQER
jgi:hypothetical protein